MDEYEDFGDFYEGSDVDNWETEQVFRDREHEDGEYFAELEADEAAAMEQAEYEMEAARERQAEAACAFIEMGVSPETADMLARSGVLPPSK
jgi:hypothetical protein